jgi:hypothetical protein
LAKELDPRVRGDERVGAVFFLLGAPPFLLVFFFELFFAMQTALSASDFGV